MSRTMMRRTLNINGTLGDLAGVLATLTEEYGIPEGAVVVQADGNIDYDRRFPSDVEVISSSVHLVFEWPADETKEN